MAFPRIIVSGIGTGGHYFPAVVTALELQNRGFEVVFLARKGCREEEIARKYGLSIFVTKARPFYGKSLTDKLLFILTLMRSVLRLNALTGRAIGLAFGGFGAVPLNISCILNRSAFYIFEPNRVPGRATRFFASAARRVFLGMPPVGSLQGKVMITGIPLRPEFKRHRQGSGGKMHRRTSHILFYGGSQGASRLNDLAVELSGSMPRRWRLTVIAGSRDHQRLLGKRIMSTRVIPFTETPWKEIDRADIVVSRAGALAGYEIMACNRKVIFIPFPFAIDRHQYHNASYFAAIGDAVVCEEKDLTAPQLSDKILEMLRRKNLKKTHLIMDAEQRIANCVVKDVVNEEK
jgi:UDP-N-acetylglucosamine--N-acetylmuramyl-(pentapeptide) pyrophosphoryl-undecaprenol N-acetylglucosamine transferase